MQRFLSVAIACSCLAWATPARAQLSSTGATLFDLQPVLSGSVSGLNYHLAIETTGTSNRISLSELSKAVLAASTLTGSTGINVNTATGVILNTGVTSLTGPTDHFLLSAVAGNITISLPQSISTTASPTFAGLTVNGAITSTGSILADSLTLTSGITALTMSAGTMTSGLFRATTGTIGAIASTTATLSRISFSGVGVTSAIYPLGSNIVTLSGQLLLTGASGTPTLTAPRVSATEGVFNSTLRLVTATANRVAVFDGSNYLGGSSVTTTELGYLSGATSVIQTQLDGKQGAISSTAEITLGGLISTTINNSGLGNFGSLSVTGTANIFGAVTLSGPVTASNTLNVTGLITGNTARLNQLGIGGAVNAADVISLTTNATQSMGLRINLGSATSQGIVITGSNGQSAMPLQLRNVTGTEIVRFGFLGGGTGADVVLTGPTGGQIEVRNTSAAMHTLDGRSSDGRVTLNASGQATADLKWSGDTVENLLFGDASADSIGIGTNTPNSSAIMDVSSTTRGFLMPRMTTTQRDAISAPATGLMLWNTTTGTVNFYNGSAWVP